MTKDEEEFFNRYAIKCKKCGGENVVMSVTEYTDYGGETGGSGGWIDFGCNDCKQNDFMLCVS